jgi:hypothetical protein
MCPQPELTRQKKADWPGPQTVNLYKMLMDFALDYWSKLLKDFLLTNTHCFKTGFEKRGITVSEEIRFKQKNNIFHTITIDH